MNRLSLTVAGVAIVGLGLASIAQQLSMGRITQSLNELREEVWRRKMLSANVTRQSNGQVVTVTLTQRENETWEDFVARFNAACAVVAAS